MKYAIVTFGCRVNQADSLRLEEDLRAGGIPFLTADHLDPGDLSDTLDRVEIEIAERIRYGGPLLRARIGVRFVVARLGKRNPKASRQRIMLTTPAQVIEA